AGNRDPALTRACHALRRDSIPARALDRPPAGIDRDAMRTAAPWVLAFALASASAAAQEDLAACRDLVLPTADELAFDRLGWRPSLAVAALEADAADLPVLLWAMNGHPLGCT